MASDSSAPWHPDRSWADSLIVLLASLSLLAAGLTLYARRQSAQRPAEQAGFESRVVEVALAGPTLLGRKVTTRDWARARTKLKEPWDRALLTVLQAEQQVRREPGVPLPEPQVVPPGPAGDGFRRAFLAAYSGGGLPDATDRREVHRRLGNGYAADLLEARLLDREGGGEALRAQAQLSLKTRLAVLSLLGSLVLGLAAAGLILGLYLLGTSDRKPAQSLPGWSLSGRAAALVLLTWFLAFFFSGTIARAVLKPWPAWHWLAPVLSYLVHASIGLLLICRAEGLSLAGLWQRVAPGRPGRDLAWGAGFLALAVLLVLLVALLANLVLKPDQSPQRDLQELVRGLSGWGPTLILLLTVAGLAPFFEEVVFRGFLLPVLARSRGMALALALSTLLFGAIHLQPWGLPTLCTLGLVMGLAMRQTGSLRTPLVVHACWNGSLFLLMRVLA